MLTEEEYEEAYWRAHLALTLDALVNVFLMDEGTQDDCLSLSRVELALYDEDALSHPVYAEGAGGGLSGSVLGGSLQNPKAQKWNYDALARPNRSNAKPGMDYSKFNANFRTASGIKKRQDKISSTHSSAVAKAHAHYAANVRGRPQAPRGKKSGPGLPKGPGKDAYRDYYWNQYSNAYEYPSLKTIYPKN